MAFRLCAEAEAGGILVSGLVHELSGQDASRFVYDREQMLASLDRLEALEKGGAKLFFGHDPDFWKDVPQAPVPAF